MENERVWRPRMESERVWRPRMEIATVRPGPGARFRGLTKVSRILRLYTGKINPAPKFTNIDRIYY